MCLSVAQLGQIIKRICSSGIAGWKLLICTVFVWSLGPLGPSPRWSLRLTFPNIHLTGKHYKNTLKYSNSFNGSRVIYRQINTHYPWTCFAFHLRHKPEIFRIRNVNASRLFNYNVTLQRKQIWYIGFEEVCKYIYLRKRVFL